MIHTRKKEREGQTVKCQQENLKQMQDQHKTLRAPKEILTEFSRHAVNYKFSMWFKNFYFLGYLVVKVCADALM